MFLSPSGQPAPQGHHLGPKSDCDSVASSPVLNPGPAEPGGAARVESSPAAFPHCLQGWRQRCPCRGVTMLSLPPPPTCLGAADLLPAEGTCLDCVCMGDAAPELPEWAVPLHCSLAIPSSGTFLEQGTPVVVM